MKFNLKTVVLDYKGKVLTQPAADRQPGEDLHEEVNFRQVINAALNNDVPGAVLTPEDKMQIYQINTKIWDPSWKPDLTHSECAFIKSRALAILNPLLNGRLDEFLEGKEAAD